MSASLVGSEMCIRDSLCSATWRARLGSQTTNTSKAPQQATRVSKRGAVSYTHLTLPTICSV
eukprot:14481249-Alexandrium_andersonii.AAC.1